MLTLAVMVIVGRWLWLLGLVVLSAKCRAQIFSRLVVGEDVYTR
jgi:hypothetical protein